MSDKPVQCRRVSTPTGTHRWQITHRDSVASWFTHGDSALQYLDKELTRWEQEQRGKELARILFALIKGE